MSTAGTTIGCSRVAASLLTSFRPTTSTFSLWQTRMAMSTAGTTIGCGERQGQERARRTFLVKSAMRDFILGERADFKLYLTFHSYGQYILYPWGYDTLDTFDFRDLHRVGNVAARALKQTNE